MKVLQTPIGEISVGTLKGLGIDVFFVFQFLMLLLHS